MWLNPMDPTEIPQQGFRSYEEEKICWMLINEASIRKRIDILTGHFKTP